MSLALTWAWSWLVQVRFLVLAPTLFLALSQALGLAVIALLQHAYYSDSSKTSNRAMPLLDVRVTPWSLVTGLSSEALK